VALIAAASGRLQPLGQGGYLWSDRHGRARQLSEAEAFVLDRCAVFRPAAEQLGELTSAGMDAGLARRLLERLAASGLLLDAAQLLAQAPTVASPIAAPPAPLLVVRSWQRPAGVARLLASLRELEQRHGAAYRIVVVDDTDDGGFAAQTSELVAAHARLARGCIRLLGPAQREQAIAALAEGVCDSRSPVLRQMLDPAHQCALSGSRSWNWAQLLGAGGCLSILDDDTSFPLRLPDDASAVYELADASEAGVRFFDADECLAARELEREPYAWLGERLGVPAVGLLRGGWRDAALRGRRADELDYLLDGAVTVGVVPGLYGGLALDTSAYVVHGTGYTQASLWRPGFSPHRLEADSVWHCYPHPRLTSHAVYTPLLLDAREPLPFAGTWGRVDDQYFLTLLRAMAAPIAFVHVSAMLGHRDLVPRGRADAALRALPVDINLFIAGLFARWGGVQAGVDRWQRLAGIATLAAGWAQADDGMLACEWLEFRRRMRAVIVLQVEAGLADPAAPPAWCTFAREVARVNRQAMIDDVASAQELARIRSALRQVFEFAQLWPRLWSRCASPDDPLRAWRA
jgi:hypothetical protein